MGSNLEIIKSEVIFSLEKEFGFLVPKDITEIAKRIDEFILNKIQTTLFQNVSYFVSGASVNPKGHIIKFKNHTYRLAVEEPFGKQKTIIVGLIEIFTNQNQHIENIKKKMPIQGIGRYNFIELFYPNTIPIKYDLLLEYIYIVFNTSYNWLLIKLKKIIRENYILTDVLYDPVKISLANFNDAKHSVWFVVKNKGNVVFLLDESNVNYALNALQKAPINSNLSSYEMLDEFIHMKIPFDKSFAGQASKIKAPINVQIDNGAYFDDMTDLAISQIGVFSRDLTVYPLSTTNKVHLYASYPTKYNNLVEPVLEANKEIINSNFKALNSKIIKMLKSLDKNNYDLSRTTEAIGSFLGAFFGSAMKS